MKHCTVDDCTNPLLAKGMCDKHYRRQRPRRKYPEGYLCYRGMLTRCFNKNNHSYKEYGERGITVCDRWLGVAGFDNFISDMGVRPSRKHTIEREDNNGNYEPNNCSWQTFHVQASNRRNTRPYVGIKHRVWAKSECWEARLMVDRKVVLSKSFSTLDDAITARNEAIKKYLL